MKEMKRIISAVMAVVLCLNLCFSTAWAENLNTAVKTTLDVSTLEVKDVDQTVALTIEMEKDIVIDGFGGQLYWPQEIKLTSISNEELGLTGGDYNLANGKFGWSSPDAENQNFKYIITAVFTVPANTTAGTYEIGVKDLEITCDYGTPYDDAKALAASSTLTISGGVTPPAHTHDLKKVDAKAATCTEDGNIEYYQCSDPTCGKLYKDAAGTQEITKDDTIIKAGHKYGNLIAEVSATCGKNGVKAHYECSVCHKNFDTNFDELTDLVIPATGNHIWELVEKEVEDATTHTKKCKVCGMTEEETHDKWPGDYPIEWTSNDDYHWHQFACGTIMNKAAHTWNEGVETTPATCTTAGVRTYTCDVCKATKTEPIPVIAHQYEWKHDETNHWQECSVCHDIIDKAEHTYASHKCEDTATCTKAECGYVKPAGQHSWNDGEVTTPATCTTDGVKTYTCKVCSETKTEPIKALGHSLTKVEAVAATCTEGGNNEYYTCSVCKKVFKADKTTETTVADETLAALGHKLTKTDAKAATCTEPGNSEYYTCGNCGKFFSDADGKTEIVKDSWVIKALDHDFTGAWVNTDAAGHYHKCSRCDATDTVVKHTFNGKPCTEEDSCNVCGYVKAPGVHAWGTAEYKWSDDYKSCTATVKCTNCEAVETDTAIIGIDTTPATCTVDGKTVYTATFSSNLFTTQTKEVTIEKLGHTYGAPVWSWSEDGKTATATFTCTREGCTAETTGHAQTVTATVSGKQNVAPTCTDKGTTTYTAKVTFETKDYTDTKDVQDIKALGHKLTKTAAKAATCTEPGNNEYWTCSVCKKVFKADKTTETTVAAETLAALGHKMTKTPAKAATCVAEGNNEYYTCSVCNKVFKDEQGNTLTTVAAETLAKDPTNHTGGTELRGAVAASCMTAGRTDDTYCKGCGVRLSVGKLTDPTGNHNYVDGVCTTCGSKQPADNATIKAAIKDFISDVVDAAKELEKKIEDATDENTKKILGKLKGYVGGSKLQAVYSVTMSLNGQNLDKGDSLADGQNVTIAISEETYNALKSGAKIVESYLDDKGEAQTREINATLKQVGGGYTVTFASDKTAVYGLMTKTSSGGSSGSGSSYTSGQSFTTDLPADSINRVTVNGKKLDSKYYTVSSNGSGSIVTLTDAYLATLKAGKYTVKIENKTHVSTGTFTIKADGTLSSPKTADAGIALYAMLAVSSLMGTAVVSKKRRKA